MTPNAVRLLIADADDERTWRQAVERAASCGLGVSAYVLWLVRADVSRHTRPGRRR